MDFCCWVVAQGEGLYNNFMQNGHQAVLDYIEQHKVPEEDYVYECMVYAFHKFVD